MNSWVKKSFILQTNNYSVTIPLIFKQNAPKSTKFYTFSLYCDENRVCPYKATVG